MDTYFDVPQLNTYAGDQPFIFVSYAHKDSKIVIPIISALQELGYRIWLDQGIEAGTEWSNNIAAHLQDCSVFLAFISHNSVVSENCLDEIAFAKSKKKISLMIFLEEDVRLPEGTEMQTARFQRIFFCRHRSVESFLREVQKTPLLDTCRELPPEVPAPEPVSQPEPLSKPEPVSPPKPKSRPEPTRKTKAVRRTPKPVKEKRPSRILIPVCGLLAVLAIGICGSLLLGSPKETITQIPGDDFYTLTPVGTIADADRDFRIADSVITSAPSAENQIFFTDYLGNPYSDQRCTDATYLGFGLYYAAFPDAQESEVLPEVNHTALVTIHGDTLIPPECGQIRWPNGQSETDCRYLLVYYATKPASTEEEHVFTLNKNKYDGYIRVFDLKTRAFADFIPPFSKANRIEICGDSLIFQDEEGNYKLYSAEGNVLMELSGWIEVGDGIFVHNSNGSYHVYDEGGNQLYYANKALHVITGTRYLSCRVEGNDYSILNADGTLFVEKSYNSFYSLNNNYFQVKSDKKIGILAPDGTELVPCQYDLIYETRMPGYFYGKAGNKYILIGPNGIIATKVSSSAANLVLSREKKVLVINRGTYDLNTGTNYLTVLAPALVVGSNENTGLCGVYDLFTGELILPCEYEKIMSAADYLYAYRSGSWEVFEIHYSG